MVAKVIGQLILAKGMLNEAQQIHVVHLMYITMATTFSHAYSTQRRHIQGLLLYQCTLNQLKVSLGEGFKSSRTLNSPHPN